MNALTWPAVLAVLLLMPAAASAQDRAAPRPDSRPEARPEARTEAADPRAATAPLVHRSALQSYRRAGGDDPPAVAWREANDTVGRIGGWRAYAREAQAAGAAPAPATAATAPAAPAPAPAPARPAGHDHHTAPPVPAPAPRR
jgi:hypothetical protein